MSATDAPTRPLGRERAARIADAFAHDRTFTSRWDYHYSRGKLASDPLYPGVCDALRGSQAPLLDLGCGLGLLAHALRSDGIALAYRGVDNDASKITRASAAAVRGGLSDVSFACVDLARALPAHSGSVVILDVLQYLAPEAQERLLEGAMAMLSPGARLVIRTGLADGSTRARVSHATDAFARVLGWMNAAPKRYPNADQLRARLEAGGLESQFTAMYGNTPFNNWQIVATRPD